MKVVRNKRCFQINFDSNNEPNTGFGNEEEKDIIEKFARKCPFFDFPYIENEEIQKFKKKVVAFAIQYGTRNQKTTSIFLNFLENTRDIGTSQLKKKEYSMACSYYSVCLGFIDPDDEIFLEKFVITKIDIINKMMYSLFELYGEKPQQKYLEWGNNFLQNFLNQASEYAFHSNLVKNDTCMLELNYFYLGRLYKKRKNTPRAIEAFLKAQEIIVSKQNNSVYQKNPNFQAFCNNLQIKIFYKTSKCYRNDQPDQQSIYEGLALRKAEKINIPLYQYLNKKIRMYKSSKLFHENLARLDGKKKIQEEILRKIQEAQQKELPSLYDVYLDNAKLQLVDLLNGSSLNLA